MAAHDEDTARLALLAHDLRTPLATMRLTGELIGQGPLTASQQEQLAILIGAIDALDQMTGELVDAARPGAAESPAKSAVYGLVRECADLFRVSACNKGLTLDVSVAPDAEDYVTIDPASLRRIVNALLDNAIKYTASGGVTVEVRRQKTDLRTPSQERSGAQRSEWITIVIEDTGPGIDAEERARLFKPFVRGRHGRAAGKGTGLGLWGTAQMVEGLGGHLSLAQPGAGGSRFEIRIPVHHPGSAQTLAAGAPRSCGEASGDGPLDVDAGQLPGLVLIVDDNDTNCRLLSALLESFGISSEIAKSGREAISLVQANDYEAVLLDLHMPGMSGIETADILNARSQGAPPLIAVTAALESVGNEQLKAAGFQDVLTKPLSPTALYESMVRTRAYGGREAPL